MGLKNTAKATVWEVIRAEKYTDLKITTSRKQKDGSWDTDFSARVRCIGKAHSKCAEVKEKDRITINDCETQAKWDKEKGQMRTTFLLWDFDILNPDGSIHKEGEISVEGFMQVPDGMEADGLPFA